MKIIIGRSCLNISSISQISCVESCHFGLYHLYIVDDNGLQTRLHDFISYGEYLGISSKIRFFLFLGRKCISL